jgi:hypothetical protein
MKLTQWLWALILVGICSPRAVASQTPVDPKLIINKGIGYPTCSPNPTSDATPKCLLNGNTIIEPFNGGMFSFDFAYTNTSVDLTSLIILITGVPEGTPYSCQSDIWSHCFFNSPTGNLEKKKGLAGPPELIVMGFVLFGSDNTHTGFIPKETNGVPFTFGVDQFIPSTTPEPGTWMLFATGILAFAVLGFRRKRRMATALS